MVLGRSSAVAPEAGPYGGGPPMTAKERSEAFGDVLACDSDDDDILSKPMTAFSPMTPMTISTATFAAPPATFAAAPTKDLLAKQLPRPATLASPGGSSSKTEDIDEVSNDSGGGASPELSASFRKPLQRFTVEAGVKRSLRPLRLSSGSGITCTNAPRFIADPALGGTPGGVFVEAIKPESAAAAAGLLVGDVIVSIDGVDAVSHEQAVAALVAATQRGSELVLHVADKTVRRSFIKGRQVLGITCEDALEGDVVERKGVVVASLKPESACRADGPCVGALLLAVNSELVRSHQHAVELIDRATDAVELVYRDHLTKLTMTLVPGARDHLVLSPSPLGLGVTVESCAGSAALAAGLEAGDVILAIDDELMRSADKASMLLKPRVQQTGARAVELRVCKSCQPCA